MRHLVYRVHYILCKMLINVNNLKKLYYFSSRFFISEFSACKKKDRRVGERSEQTVGVLLNISNINLSCTHNYT